MAWPRILKRMAKIQARMNSSSDACLDLMHKILRNWRGRMHLIHPLSVQTFIRALEQMISSATDVMSRIIEICKYFILQDIATTRLPTVKDYMLISSGEDEHGLFSYLLDLLDFDPGFVNSLTSASFEYFYRHRASLSINRLVILLENVAIPLDCRLWTRLMRKSIVSEPESADLDLFALTTRNLARLRCPQSQWVGRMWLELGGLDFYFVGGGDWTDTGPFTLYLRHLSSLDPKLLIEAKADVEHFDPDVLELIKTIEFLRLLLGDQSSEVLQDEELRLRSKIASLGWKFANGFIKSADYFLAITKYDYDVARTAGSHLAYSVLLEATSWLGRSPSQFVSLLIREDYFHLLQFWLAHRPDAIWPSEINPKDMSLMAFAVLLRHFGLNPLYYDRKYEETSKRKAIIAYNYRTAFGLIDFDDDSSSSGSERTVRLDLLEPLIINIYIPQRLAMKESPDGLVRLLRAIAFAVLGIPMHNSLYYLKGFDLLEPPTDRELAYFIQYWASQAWPQLQAKITVTLV